MPSITLSYATPDGRTLLADLDLTFGPERTGLVGRNGVGKSTLLDIVSGRRSATAGTIAVAGTLDVLRQDVGAEPGETIARLLGIEDAPRRRARPDDGRRVAAEALASLSADNAPAPRWRLSSSPRPISASSTSRRTISTSRRSKLWRPG